jgi:hypothetical protein
METLLLRGETLSVIPEAALAAIWNPVSAKYKMERQGL